MWTLDLKDQHTHEVGAASVCPPILTCMSSRLCQLFPTDADAVVFHGSIQEMSSGLSLCLEKLGTIVALGI
jgi:hypothetical protein